MLRKQIISIHADYTQVIRLITRETAGNLEAVQKNATPEPPAGYQTHDPAMHKWIAIAVIQTSAIVLLMSIVVQVGFYLVIKLTSSYIGNSFFKSNSITRFYITGLIHKTCKTTLYFFRGNCRFI